MGRISPTVTDAQNPPVRRRELGALLRALRSDAGLTVDEVAERLLCSPAKISRMETGQRGASQRDVRDLCQVYGVTDSARYEHLMELARQSRGQPWWQSYNLPYATYVGLETEAISINDYESGVIPGLFQIPGYTRAVHQGYVPQVKAEVIEQRISERVNRQKILTRANPPELHAIMDEAILHRIVGGPAVMAAQLGHVLEQCEILPSVTVQILPFSAGAHPALDSTFVLLEMADPVPSVVYVEGLVGQVYMDRPQDVHRYQQVFERLQSLSLSRPDSMDMIESAKAQFQP
jgi:transcriptional regulator with XRE-family HTH domain